MIYTCINVKMYCVYIYKMLINVMHLDDLIVISIYSFILQI